MDNLSIFVHGRTSSFCDQPLPQDAYPDGFRPATGSRLIVLRPAPYLPSIGFACLRPMVAGMVRELTADGDLGAFLSRWGSEFVFLFPQMQTWNEFQQAVALVDIAVAPSRRRLHKESEQIFRVTQALVHLVLEWAGRYAPQGLHIRFEHLQAMDEHTLRFFVRLSRCLGRSPQVSISASAALGDERPLELAPVPPGSALLPQAFLQRSALRSSVLRRVCNESRMLAREHWHEESFGSAISFAAPSGGDTAEAAATQSFLHALEGGNPATVGPALLAALESSIFTQNHDHAQWLIEQAAPVYPRLLPPHKRELFVHIGIMQAFTMDFERALAAMDQSLLHAQSAIEQAEGHFFAGLLLIKRMGRTGDGRARLNMALEVLKDIDAPEAHCERAWLHNIMALSYVNEKDLAGARVQCRQALAHLKSAPRSPDTTHIKINVVSNLTVLDEYGKDLDSAIQRWAFFEPLLGHANPVFKKHYLFRKAGLLVKAGRLDQALPYLLECHGLTRQTGDDFYGDVVARGIAGVYWHLGQPVHAAEWYRTSLQAKQLLLDDDVAEVSLALARCLARSGAVAELGPLLDALETTYTPAQVETIAALRAVGASGASLPAWSAPLPETKLNRPFTFTNLH